MGWICHNCSSFNDDGADVCFVCDCKRKSKKICTLTYNKVQRLGLHGHVVIPEEFNVIGEGAFKGRGDIYTVTLHDGVRKIGKEAFAGCSNLIRIIYDGEIETVSTRAFADCTSLPESARVKSEYVADDAYYFTPKPPPPPPPPRYTGFEPPRLSEISITEDEPEALDTPPRRPMAEYIPTRIRRWIESNEVFISRLKTLGIILLCCGIIFSLIIDLFIEEYQLYAAEFYTFVGTAILLTLISAVYAVCVICSGDIRELISPDTLLVPYSLVQMTAFVLMILYGSGANFINHILVIGMLLLGSFLYTKAKEREEYRTFPILIACIIETIVFEILLWVHNF